MYTLTSAPQPAWVLSVLTSYEQDARAVDLIHQLAVDVQAVNHFQLKLGLLYYKDRLYVGSSTELRNHLISLYHDSALGAHSRVNSTYLILRRHFYWPGMQSDVLNWVKQCDSCARCKGKHCALPSLLQPLPAPSQAWQHISKDFIEQLPKSKDKNTILVIVRRFTKYGHFIPLAHPFTAATVVKVFLNHSISYMELLFRWFRIGIKFSPAFFGRNSSSA